MDSEEKRDKTIGIIGTLDTKGTEIHFVKKELETKGLSTIIIDTGVLGEPQVDADITRQQIAKAGGTILKNLVEEADSQSAMSIMAKGAAEVIKELYSKGKLSGLIALGGGRGTAIAAQAMRELPIGFPKIIVSTVASGNTRRHIGSKDIIMIPSITDLVGLNTITRKILLNAIGAIVGMVKVPNGGISTKRVIAITSFGVTNPAVVKAKSIIEKKGFEVLVFHATGVGGIAMEELIEKGIINGVLDLTTTELADELVGGVGSAGPHRLEMAGKKGIPQIIVPGALDIVNFGPRDTIPESLKNRKSYQHHPSSIILRTNKSENTKLGEIMARKINNAKGCVVIVIPNRGFSAYDKKGGVFYDPECDAAYVKALKKNLRKNIKLVEVNAHINDDKFVEKATQELFASMGAKKNKKSGL